MQKVLAGGAIAAVGAFCLFAMRPKKPDAPVATGPAMPPIEQHEDTVAVVHLGARGPLLTPPGSYAVVVSPSGFKPADPMVPDPTTLAPYFAADIAKVVGYEAGIVTTTDPRAGSGTVFDVVTNAFVNAWSKKIVAPSLAFVFLTDQVADDASAPTIAAALDALRKAIPGQRIFWVLDHVTSPVFAAVLNESGEEWMSVEGMGNLASTAARIALATTEAEIGDALGAAIVPPVPSPPS